MYGVLLLPDFALQAAWRHRPELRVQPVAIVGEAAAGKPVILQLSEAARAAGAAEGMSTSQGLARCASLVLLERSPAQEAAAGQALLECGFACSPWVEATAPGVCTFELRSARREQGRLAREAVARLGQLDLDARAGLAKNPDLALLAAHQGRPVLQVADAAGFLGELPLSVLSPPTAMAAILAQWGVRTLGEFAALPMTAVGDRLGPDALALWERAAGRAERLLRLTSPPAVYEEQIDFEAEIETLEPLLFMLRRFLEQLVVRLDAVYRVPAELHLTLGLAAGGEHVRAFHLPSPTRNVDMLFRVVHTHLEDFSSPSPIARLGLAAVPAIAPSNQLGLFETALRDPNRFGETLARLQALLGPDRAGSPCLIDTHEPDAFRMGLPQFAQTGTRAGDRTPATLSILLGLPLRRLRPPVRAQVDLRDHAPARVTSTECSACVQASRGPYRLSGRWWDEGRWACEEWDVQLADGRLYRLSARDGGEWLVEGAYD